VILQVCLFLIGNLVIQIVKWGFIDSFTSLGVCKEIRVDLSKQLFCIFSRLHQVTMSFRNLKHIFFVMVSAGVFILLNITGCAKEYSFEGSNTHPRDTVIVPPPPPPAASELPHCSSCDHLTTPVQLNHWSLKAQQSQACGTIDTAIITLERTSFTFFGPSSCSRDTGMVITAYLNESLDRDKTNIQVSRVAFYYYDRVTPSYIYMTYPTTPFYLHIDTYNHQTKIATGTFGGSGVKVNGSNTVISEGKFSIKLL